MPKLPFLLPLFQLPHHPYISAKGHLSSFYLVFRQTANKGVFPTVHLTRHFPSSASTLTLNYGNDYLFTGTTTTWTLPAVSSSIAARDNGIMIKNRGSGSITLNSASGSTIYTTSAQSSITIAAGAGCYLLPDGTYFNVQYNQ